MDSKDIKNALWCCEMKVCKGCPREGSDSCQMGLAHDALKLIKSLETDVAYYTVLSEIRGDTVEAMNALINDLEKKLKKNGEIQNERSHDHA